MTRIARTLLFLVCASAAGCSDGPTGPVTPPAVLVPNGLLSATVGTSLSYDATRGGTVFSDPAGGGLTYSVIFAGPSNGLQAAGGTVSGTPAVPGIVSVTVTATDNKGRTASDQFAIVVFAAGLPTPSLPALPYPYTDAAAPFPAHFLTVTDGLSVVATDNTPAANPITNAGATLGRVLFYDRRLSANDGISCGSCHVQSLGFGDPRQRSVGFAGGLTGRHSPALVNARFYQRGRFFWDERAATLEAQVVTPIQDATEMGMPLDVLVQKLTVTPYYAPLFTQAFGSPTVTSDRIAQALAQYVRSLVSADSRYDRAIAAGSPTNLVGLTTEEKLGEQLFRSQACTTCHVTTAQVSDGPHNVGLDAVDNDPGVAGVGTGRFKSPSLRNVAVRGRYMHDGRFTSLAQVIDFYDSGVQANPGLSSHLRAPDGSPRRMGLSVAEKSAMEAFLRTLTDSTFLTAPKFSNPFAVPAAPPAPGAVRR
ncbi:MAG TPA: cytochrome c peroxidase [Longimicrobiaceae bacterium]|nr:cytochrome c peroxidase [Longimicrobiaceae bacterium]